MLNAFKGGGSRTILLSRRANIFYLDRVRVSVRNERVVYRQEHGEEYFDYNLPDCNTSLVLLGKGTSITDAAVRALAKSGVVIGFCGTGGTPPHAIVDYVFLNPTDEYRPTEYCIAWMTMWLDSAQRLQAARFFQDERIRYTQKFWEKHHRLTIPQGSIDHFREGLKHAQTEQDILVAEAVWTKSLYGFLCRHFSVNDFQRRPGEGQANVNGLLDHGNYLMYGVATVALHALGIPAALPLVHGKTRRGALVFDVADVLKDALVMPLAFVHAFDTSITDRSERHFRAKIIESLLNNMAIDVLIETIKSVIEK